MPTWERRPPTPAPPSRFFRLVPVPPGAVRVPGNPSVTALLRADENGLLAGAEHPGRGDAGAAGRWLEAAGAWGRLPDALAAKQDRVAARLLAAQADDGTFGLRAAGALWSPSAASSQRSCLRGLLAYYAAAHQPAAIQAALMSGSRMLRAAQETPEAAWVYPLARLSEETNDKRFLTAARRQATAAGEVSAEDGLGLCALYEATGQPTYLASARRVWTQNSHSASLTAEMLLLTGRPGYAAALDHLPTTDSSGGAGWVRAAWTRAPRGIAINTTRSSEAVIGSLHMSQQSGHGRRTITIGAAKPTSAWLYLFLPPGVPPRIWINGVVQPTPAPPSGYAILERRWRNGDVVKIALGTGQIMSLPATRPNSAPALP